MVFHQSIGEKYQQLDHFPIPRADNKKPSGSIKWILFLVCCFTKFFRMESMCPTGDTKAKRMRISEKDHFMQENEASLQSYMTSSSTTKPPPPVYCCFCFLLIIKLLRCAFLQTCGIAPFIASYDEGDFGYIIKLVVTSIK